MVILDPIWNMGWKFHCTVNPGSTFVTGSWGGRFAHSTVNWSGNCNGSVSTSPTDSPRSPIIPCVARRCVREYFFHRRHQKFLWNHYNHVNPRVRRQRQNRNFSNVTENQYFWSKITLLVWVTVSGFLLRPPCVSLAVAIFNSYPVSFIVKFLNALNTSSNLSSFSLVNTAVMFSLYELDAWLNVSAVTLLASIIYPYSSSLVTFKISSQIFT